VCPEYVEGIVEIAKQGATGRITTAAAVEYSGGEQRPMMPFAAQHVLLLCAFVCSSPGSTSWPTVATSTARNNAGSLPSQPSAPASSTQRTAATADEDALGLGTPAGSPEPATAGELLQQLHAPLMGPDDPFAAGGHGLVAAVAVVLYDSGMGRVARYDHAQSGRQAGSSTHYTAFHPSTTRQLPGVLLAHGSNHDGSACSACTQFLVFPVFPNPRTHW
jgi:hypothetical protein